MKSLNNLFARLTLALLVFMGACHPKPRQLERPQPLPQVPFISVYFNQNQAQGADYTEPYRQITRPGDNLEGVMVEAIASARSTIDVAVQELRLPQLAQALAERQRAGVQVRVILENTYSRPFSEFTPSEIGLLADRDRQRYDDFQALADANQDSQLSSEESGQKDALVILHHAGIPVIDDTADGSKGSGLMHHKFIIVDGRTVLTGSANHTPSDMHGDLLGLDSRGNANNLLKIDSSQLAALFSEEFNLMWGDGPGGRTDSKFGLKKPLRSPYTVAVGNAIVTLQFSPSSPRKPWQLSSNGVINERLKTAKKTVNLALFVFSEQKLADTLEAARQQGVSIKALIDPGFAFQYYSEGLDLLGVSLSNRCRYEKENHPWSVPLTTVGIPRLPQGDKLHHKFGIIDGQTIITGSHNWSTAANSVNDETVLIIQSPAVAAHYTREFERLYTNAVLGIPVYLQQKIQQDRQRCP